MSPTVSRTDCIIEYGLTRVIKVSFTERNQQKGKKDNTFVVV